MKWTRWRKNIKEIGLQLVRLDSCIAETIEANADTHLWVLFQSPRKCPGEPGSLQANPGSAILSMSSIRVAHLDTFYNTLQYHVIRMFLQHPQSQINMQLWLWRCSSRFPGWNLESPGTSCLTQLDFRCMDRTEPVNIRSFLLCSFVLPSLPCLFFSTPAHVWHATWSHSQIGGDTQWFWLRRFKYAHVSVDVYVHDPTYS